MQTSAIGPRLPDSYWTKENIELALQESEQQGHHEKIQQLAQTTMPEAFAYDDPVLSYRFIRALLESHTEVTRRIQRLYLQALKRIIPASSQSDDCALVDLQSDSTHINKYLLQLTLPGLRSSFASHALVPLPLSAHGVSQLKNWMYSDFLDANLSVKDLLGLMATARAGHNDQLRRKAFSVLIEALSHQLDTVEERCALLGLCCLDSACFKEIPRFKKYQQCFADALHGLSSNISVLSLPPKLLGRLCTEDEWHQILRSLALLSDDRSRSPHCLGPIRPHHLQVEYTRQDTLEAASLQAILRADVADVSIRLRTVQDYTKWVNLCRSRLCLGQGVLVTGVDGLSHFQRIDRIEVDERLAELLNMQLAQRGLGPRDVRTLIPSPIRRQGVVVVGLSPFQEYIPYPNR